MKWFEMIHLRSTEPETIRLMQRNTKRLLNLVNQFASDYLEKITDRNVAPVPSAVRRLVRLAWTDEPDALDPCRNG